MERRVSPGCSSSVPLFESLPQCRHNRRKKIIPQAAGLPPYKRLPSQRHKSNADGCWHWNAIWPRSRPRTNAELKVAWLRSATSPRKRTAVQHERKPCARSINSSAISSSSWNAPSRKNTSGGNKRWTPKSNLSLIKTIARSKRRTMKRGESWKPLNSWLPRRKNGRPSVSRKSPELCKRPQLPLAIPLLRRMPNGLLSTKSWSANWKKPLSSG